MRPKRSVFVVVLAGALCGGAFAQEAAPQQNPPVDLEEFRKLHRIGEVVEASDGTFTLNLLYLEGAPEKEELKKFYKNAVAVDYDTAIRITNDQFRRLYGRYRCAHSQAIEEMTVGRSSRHTGFRAGCNDCRTRREIEQDERAVWASLWKHRPEPEAKTIPLVDDLNVVDAKATGGKLIITPLSPGKATVHVLVQPEYKETQSIGLGGERPSVPKAWSHGRVRVKVLDPNRPGAEEPAKGPVTPPAEAERVVLTTDPAYPAVLAALAAEVGEAKCLMIVEILDKSAVAHDFFRKQGDSAARWLVAFVRLGGQSEHAYASVLLREKAPGSNTFVATIPTD